MSAIRRAAEAGVAGALRQMELAVANTPREDLPGLLADLERIRATGWLRLAVPPVPEAETDRLLDAKETAAMLGIEVSALYRRHWAFRVEVSPGRTRFSLRGIQRFIRAREGR